jgi:hypothetical protein
MVDFFLLAKQPFVAKNGHFLGKIDHKTRNMQFTIKRATHFCSLIYLEHFCKMKYANPISCDQERPI